MIHPGYAGLFAYGRSKLEKRMAAGGNVITRQRRLPRDQWAVMIPGHHPGYISVEWTHHLRRAAPTAQLRHRHPRTPSSGGS